MCKNYPKNKSFNIITFFISFSMFLFIYMLLLAISIYVVLPAIKSDYNYIIEYIFIWGSGITSYRVYDKLKV